MQRAAQGTQRGHMAHGTGTRRTSCTCFHNKYHSSLSTEHTMIALHATTIYHIGAHSPLTA
eukprot:1138014-Pelagomonas_calceolata.AAC.4